VARAQGSKKPDPRRVRLPTSGLEGALDLLKLLINGSRAGLAANPRNLQIQKVRGNRLPPRNGPTDQGFET
jgi:hypothetical protein